ncbi:hypothetical protein A3F59_02025 [Candidatus Roizmanbacteria bacterium RIFCSPHIGHO2_12_FULL_38_13]|nr:MAG: hypothetical protein A2905_03805 [Candidatus Levybacteria bacterium RIFCSPLOWO2_01_FULL_36_10]OGK35697.1 MAG: hypothetical protein A3F59_02025 [Candidatus Roizmanbacteria bacterium RIFCSPHIGHO2_12_FULL_38_13]
MKKISWMQNKQITLFLLSSLAWYFLAWTEYDYEKMLPQVHMGAYNSWPLYFFLIDTFAIGLVLFYGSILWVNRKSKQLFRYVLLGLLLLYPLLLIYATYDDLYSRVCIKLDPVARNCKEYRPHPDLSNIYFEWE